MNKPDFIIIGAMKCGTTTLHAQLVHQPGIFMPTPTNTEINFFSDDETYGKGRNWYYAQFEEAGKEDIIGERSTHYTKLPTYPETVKRMKELLPEAKLIYMMRHPIERLVSQYVHQWSEGEILVPIDKAIDKHPELTYYSLYGMQLKPYIEAYGKKNILPVFLERFSEYPAEELRRICEFIGYGREAKWNIIIEGKNISNERLRKNRIRNVFVDSPYLKELRRKYVPKLFRNSIKKFWKIRKKPRLSLDNFKKLEMIFNKDLSTLSRWLGKDLTCENFDKIITFKRLEWENKQIS